MSDRTVLSHLQFAVIGLLRDGERTGRSIRLALAEEGIDKSGPAFYQLMSRLEEAGLVEGWYDDRLIRDLAVKERHYRLTNGGREAWDQTLDFYLSHAGMKKTNNPRRTKKAVSQVYEA